jgi:hypothetical protein
MKSLQTTRPYNILRFGIKSSLNKSKMICRFGRYIIKPKAHPQDSKMKDG